MRYQLVLLALVASGCQLTNTTPVVVDKQEVTFGPRPQRVAVKEDVAPSMPTGEVQGDGSLAPAEAPGSVRVVQESLREVEGVSSGKVWLLELYQRTLSDKEDLVRRLDASERERATFEAERTVLVAERDKLAARSAELDQRVRALETQSLDLARRLAESEIGRLEAQKTALEQEAKNDRKERP